MSPLRSSVGYQPPPFLPVGSDTERSSIQDNGDDLISHLRLLLTGTKLSGLFLWKEQGFEARVVPEGVKLS